MAARIGARIVAGRLAAAVAAALSLAALAAQAPAPAPTRPAAEDVFDVSALERDVAIAARAGRHVDVLTLLVKLQNRDPARYRSGRFDYLTGRALAGLGRLDEALQRYDAFVASGDLLAVPARLAAGRLRFAKGDASGGIDLLLPLLQRKEGAVARRAARIVLDALETAPDGRAITRLAALDPPFAPRERRRLAALQADALEAAGALREATALRRRLLSEGKRDDAAAIVLARELREATPERLDDAVLSLLIDAARAQRDLDLAERLAVERDRRAFLSGEPSARLVARFDLTRLRASRGKFVEAEAGYRSVLQMSPKAPPPGRNPRDDSPGTAGFYARVRFNLGAMLEKQGKLNEAALEFQRVEGGGAGPRGLAALQRARLELRRENFARAESILNKPSFSKEPGWIEGRLLLLTRYAEAHDGAAASRALAPVLALANARKLPEPWLSEIPFWRGRAAEAAGDVRTALSEYAEAVRARPDSIAAQLAAERMRGFEPARLRRFLERERTAGVELLARDARGAKANLTAAAALGDAAARDALTRLYRSLPAYAAILEVPQYPEEVLPNLCGDAAACRLIQMGLPEDAEPIVRDAQRLDSLNGCVLAARLAEEADAGPAALDAAEALRRRIPQDFLLELAPPVVLRALSPRPFDRLAEEASRRTDVPKDVLYAVMRQESRFDREAVSPAAARGLMQLTLPAAGEAARDLNEEPPAYFDLYDPGRSLNLGAQTLKGLLARFDGDAAAVVSAYNAGAGQTYLWCGGASSTAEALLASISYTETRTYFRRVLTNRRLYQLAAESTAPAVADSQPARR